MEDKNQYYYIDQSLANKFTEYMEKHGELYRYLAKKTKENIQESIKKPIIIDLSIGPGFLSYELNKLIPQAQILGLDPATNMLSIAKNKLTGCKQCSLVIGTVENMPLKNDYADVIVSRFGLSSWRNPKKGLLETYRVLKPKSRLVLEILNKDFPKWKLLMMKIHMRINGAGDKVIKYNISSYKNALSLGQIEQFLIETGFKIVSKEGKKADWKFLIVASKK
ncbi:MAG: methyltransferase domain-containing protein [Candidatus Lokiarchaeia archaeon]|nr:methyltransferase domain-containing protein [Candidatus Lokiarchaeia archaeon]